MYNLVLLPGKSHGWGSLVGCSPWGREESDRTKRLHFHFSLSCIGEGNGNPLQCSCLENPRDGGAWWAAISGVAQSRTRLKWLSSSSRYIHIVGQYLITIHPQNFIVFPNWHSVSIKIQLPTTTSLYSLPATILLSVSMNWTTWDTSCKSNHTAFVLLSVAYFA